MARVDTLSHFLADVANAIRKKTGKSDLIEASDFDNEIASISGGGGIPTPKNNTDFLNYQLELINNYNNYLNDVLNNYEALINQSITLYIPWTEGSSLGNRYNYMIQKRTNGNYRIVWSNAPYVRIVSSKSQAVQGYNVVFMGKKSAGLDELEGYYFDTSTTTGSVTTGIYTLYSNEFSTLNGLIDAIQDSTFSNISYTEYRSGTGFAGVIDNEWLVPITNCVVFNANQEPVIAGRILSHDETIILYSNG